MSAPAHPPNNTPACRSSELRAPKRPRRVLPERLQDLSVPLLAGITIGPLDNDLTRQHDGDSPGEGITVSGSVRDEHGAPVSGALVEVWQANAAVHFSVLSDAFAQRLVTQMSFPGDPLLLLDPLYNAMPDPEMREQLVARWSLELTQPEWSLGYEWNIVVAGRDATPLHDDGEE